MIKKNLFSLPAKLYFLNQPATRMKAFGSNGRRSHSLPEKAENPNSYG
jgi:hypothetical protein